METLHIAQTIQAQAITIRAQAIALQALVQTITHNNIEARGSRENLQSFGGDASLQGQIHQRIEKSPRNGDMANTSRIQHQSIENLAAHMPSAYDTGDEVLQRAQRIAKGPAMLQRARWNVADMRWEYQLLDNNGSLYKNGEWVSEKILSQGGTNLCIKKPYLSYEPTA